MNTVRLNEHGQLQDHYTTLTRNVRSYSTAAWDHRCSARTPQRGCRTHRFVASCDSSWLRKRYDWKCVAPPMILHLLLNVRFPKHTPRPMQLCTPSTMILNTRLQCHLCGEGIILGVTSAKIAHVDFKTPPVHPCNARL